MIEARNLSKSFGNIPAVSDISFMVQEGETVVLLGTSGCGKTTTLKMINRLIEPDRGVVLINGKDSAAQAPELLRRQMGYVLQDIGLFPHYTIAENIAVVPDLLGWDKTKTRSRAEVLLGKFHLSPETYLPLYPDQLSGGQRQRVGFARALMANPPIILMDEPLGALDPITRHQIRKEFTQLDELNGKTIVMVTHDIPEAFELGDRICLMDKGKIQQVGTAAELLLHPGNNFVRDFFASNKFQLLLGALKIKDILPAIPRLEPYHPDGEAMLSSDADILEAIERLSVLKAKERTIVISEENSGQYYRLGIGELLDAFQQKINQA